MTDVKMVGFQTSVLLSGGPVVSVEAMIPDPGGKPSIHDVLEHAKAHGILEGWTPSGKWIAFQVHNLAAIMETESSRALQPATSKIIIPGTGAMSS